MKKIKVEFSEKDARLIGDVCDGLRAVVQKKGCPDVTKKRYESHIDFFLDIWKKIQG